MTGGIRKEVSEAVDVLKSGGIVVYPTETVYGIGCDPLCSDSVDRIRFLKGREEGKAMLLLASSLDQVMSFTGIPDDLTRRLADAFWPGPLTIVLRPVQSLPDYLYGTGGGVAVRVTPHADAALLAEGLGSPVISTSANISGQPPAASFEEALIQFGDNVGCVLDSTEPMGGVPSTIVDVDGTTVRLLREGGISMERIHEVI